MCLRVGRMGPQVRMDLDRRTRTGARDAPNGKALSDTPALKPYWENPAVGNFREGYGNVGIIPSPLRAMALPDTSIGDCPLLKTQIRAGQADSSVAEEFLSPSVLAFQFPRLQCETRYSRPALPHKLPTAGATPSDRRVRNRARARCARACGIPPSVQERPSSRAPKGVACAGRAPAESR